MPVAAGASKEAPHGEENTGVDAHPPIAFRRDRRTSVVAEGTRGAGQAGDALDYRGDVGGGGAGRGRPGVLRARGGAGQGLSQRLSAGPAEDRGGSDRLFGAPGRRQAGAVPLGDPRTSEGADASAGGPGDGAARPWPFGARHRGRVPRRERPAAAVAHRGLGDRRAAVGGLPGVCEPGPLRIRHHLPVRRWDRRTASSGAATRAGAGGLGAYRRRRPRCCCI